MTLRRKYDTLSAGFISAIVIPVFTGIVIWLFSAGKYSLSEYVERIEEAGIVTHMLSLCVFVNVVIFIIFNRYDMLRAARGVLGMTIIWAVGVFLIKLL